MRHKLLTLFALMLFMSGAQTVQAEAMHIKIELLTGEETFQIAQIGKITFADNLMHLYGNDGRELGATSLDLINRIVFNEEQGGTVAISNIQTSTIQVFPNPAQDALFIHGVEGQQTVRIFSMQGLLLMQSAETADGDAILQVGGLQNGTYLLQIGAQVVKFIKE